MDVKLSRPFIVAPAAGDQPERSVDSVALALEGLTGADVELCAREALIAGGMVPPPVLTLDPGFQAHLAARASGHDVAVLRRLPARDFLAVTQAVQGFLFGSD